MKQHYVYMLIDPSNNEPFYVGKGQGDRMYHHTQPSQRKYNPLKAHRIKKILERGDDIVYKMIIFEDEQQAFNYEIELIKKYGKFCDGTGILTNLDDGGRGGSSGRPITTAVRKKLKLRKRTLHSKEGRKAIGVGHEGPKTKEHRDSIQRSCPTSNPVVRFDLIGGEIVDYVSARDASIKTGVDCSQIIYCCKGRYKTAGGFGWRYKLPPKSLHGKTHLKPVAQLNKSGEIIRLYDSVGNAAKMMNTSRGFISRACQNLDSTAFGFYWRYV